MSSDFCHPHTNVVKLFDILHTFYHLGHFHFDTCLTSYLNRLGPSQAIFPTLGKEIRPLLLLDARLLHKLTKTQCQNMTTFCNIILSKYPCPVSSTTYCYYFIVALEILSRTCGCRIWQVSMATSQGPFDLY